MRTFIITLTLAVTALLTCDFMIANLITDQHFLSPTARTFFTVSLVCTCAYLYITHPSSTRPHK